MAQYVELSGSGVIIPEREYAEMQSLGKKPYMGEVATEEIGMDVINPWFVNDMIKPPSDTVLRDKGNYFNYKLYDDIARDDQVKAARQQRELALIGKEWGVTPGDDSRAAKKAADLLSDVLNNNLAVSDWTRANILGWDATTQKMLAALLYGYAVAEILWATDGTSITISDIKVRHRARFGFFPNGELRLKTAYTISAGQALDPGKFWAFSCGADHDDEHYGLGLGHYLYWPVFFKKSGLRTWLTFLDKFAQPTTVGKYPSSATDVEKTKLMQALRAVHSSTSIRIPDTMSVELMQAARSGTADYTSLYDRMNAAISKVYVGHTGSLDATPGKLGGEDTADQVREDLIKADADLVCGSFNRTVARWLTYYNFGGNVKPPKVWRKTDPPADLMALANKDKVLFDMGYKPTLKYICEAYEGDYQEITPPGAPITDGTANLKESAKGTNTPVLYSEPTAKVKDIDPTPVSAETDILAAAAGASVQGMIDTVRGMLEHAESLEDFRDRLLNGFGSLDSTELEKIMALGFSVADLAGRFDVSEGG